MLCGVIDIVHDGHRFQATRDAAGEGPLGAVVVPSPLTVTKGEQLRPALDAAMRVAQRRLRAADVPAWLVIARGPQVFAVELAGFAGSDVVETIGDPDRTDVVLTWLLGDDEPDVLGDVLLGTVGMYDVTGHEDVEVTYVNDEPETFTVDEPPAPKPKKSRKKADQDAESVDGEAHGEEA